jgi:hypothetical protein
MQPRFFRPLVLAASLALPTARLSGDASKGLFADPLPSHYRTGHRLTTALQQPISASWKGVPLRTVLRRLSHEREVAILLDRRVDPDQLVQVETGDRPFRSAVNEVARTTQLGVTQVGNCLVVAPPIPVLRLRTLIALRDTELSRAASLSGSATQLRAQRATIAWDDLERPADIVSRIGRQFGLTIVGLDQIPHDLWAGATLPEVTAVEALSLVLNQFDLTFEWVPRESSVRLVRVPDRVAIERTYTLRNKSAPQTLRTLQSEIEGLDAETQGNKLVVRGTLEQHEAVSAVIRGSKGSGSSKSKQLPVQVEKHSFELQAGGVSLQELFEELKKQGLPIEYSAVELRAAGIDLDRKVSVNLPRLSATQFLTRLLDPHGLTFEFEHGTVVISPKRPRQP